MKPLVEIRAKIEESKAQSSIAAADVALLGASKGQNAATLEPFLQAGLTDFGENKVQEAAEKWPPLLEKHPNTRLHLIGPLQTNKAKQALDLFHVIQTLDRPKLANAIAKELEKPEYDNTDTKAFYVQVNIGDEPQKAGIGVKETPEFISYCQGLGLNVVGLMCIPPIDKHPAPYFALLRKLAMENDLTELSMGMSGDFEEAVRMGATCIRVGTALFGKRN